MVFQAYIIFLTLNPKNNIDYIIFKLSEIQTIIYSPKQISEKIMGQPDLNLLTRINATDVTI